MNTEKKPLLCVASTSWHSNFVQSTVELASLLANDREVIFVDYAITWKDFLWALIKKNNLDWRKYIGLKPRTERISTRYGSELTILYLPPIAPINWISQAFVFDFFNWLNAKICQFFIKKELKNRNWKTFSVMNAWNPIHGVYYLNNLGEDSHFYYCYDEISAAKWIGKHGGRYETEFAKKVDFVVTTSKQLLKNKQLYNPKTFWLPNGVDFELFNPDAKCFEKTDHHVNKIGYIGSIDDRIDVETMVFAIEQNPDFEFVFIGRVTDPNTESKLDRFENVIFVPSQKPEELPKWVAEFDVGIIPFKKNKFTQNIYPMKINEYLSLGKAVVSTDFSDLDEFKTICHIVHSKEEFSEALKNAVATDNLTRKQERVTVANLNSWRNRAKLLSDWIG